MLVLGTLLGSAQAAPAIFTVNDTRDLTDSGIGDGLCKTYDETCTLRAAIQESNALAGVDTINVLAGIYELEIPSINTDASDSGDFDITDSVNIIGADAASTIIDGGFPPDGSPLERHGMDRLFEIHPGARNVTISNLTIREGFSPEEGAGIQSWSPGVVRLRGVRVHGNFASKVGGGVNLADPSGYPWVTAPVPMPRPGRIEIVDSTLSGNASGGGGAAVNNAHAGTISIMNSRVVDNPGEMIPDPEFVPDPANPNEPAPLVPAPGVYEPDSTAIVNQGEFDTVGTIHITDSTVSGNIANHPGGGISNAGHGILIVEGSTITGNSTDADGGGIYSNGGTFTVRNSTISANSAHSGGGIYSAGDSNAIGLRSRVEITDTRIAGNEADQVPGNLAMASGGGMLLDGDAHNTLTDVTISGNKAGDAGGGFSNEGRTNLVATRLTVTNNKTNGEGGGAYVESERPSTIRDSVFSGNHAGVADEDDLQPVGKPGDPVFDPLANTAGGGGMYTEGGPVDIAGSTFSNNSATEEGGGISIDNFGAVTISDSVVRDNRAGQDGGGIENSGMRVTFDRLLVTGNKATLDGGGIYNSSSGEFLVIDSTLQRNTALDGGGFANAPDADLIIRQTSIIGNTARMPGIDDAGLRLDGGEGGGFWSKADGDALIENTTISGNKAGLSGGGMFHDADGLLKLSNVTVWGNAALAGGGIGIVESDFAPEVPPKANESVVLRNSVVGGSTSGGSCDWYLTSEGGNVSGGSVPYVPIPGLISSDSPPVPAIGPCFIAAPPGTDSTTTEGLRDRYGDAKLDAIADNGGPTMTNALRYGSLAIDTALSPCPATDQRGVVRPQNSKCDAGAFEFVGPPPPADEIAPDTQYLTGPVQDTLDTVAFTFTGSDNVTPTDELQYECRLVELDFTEAPEPVAPWEPIPPELMWGSCLSPWSVAPSEEGMWDFEVRAIDRAGNVDETPAVHHFNGADTSPPQTFFTETPPLVSNSRAATFTFTGADNITPPEFLTFECRIDTHDPDLWVECFNPFLVSNLTTGTHEVEVRALDAGENIDPTPARYTWTVGQPANCDEANIALTAIADGWVDQVNPTENYVFANELTVRGESVGDPTASPPEPVIGQNARALVRFALPNDASQCHLESATLRLYAESGTPGRGVEVLPLTGPFKESTLTWSNQPGAAGTSVRADSREHAGYMEWNVTDHVRGMMESGLSHGWQVRDAFENDPEGGDQAFASRELPQDPPDMTMPELVLVYEPDGAEPPPPPTLPENIEPTTVHCGQVLKQHTLVANDLYCELGEGLSVAASNVVIDLNGHTISGPDYILGNV
ncbi:MAG TPA: choice-of-anchor Q domain-containing protein, partial [Actinomycetota bacterium]|nr:choice-of-anchor Q domain-containing protein [Actinomycetota bacterium]